MSLNSKLILFCAIVLVLINTCTGCKVVFRNVTADITNNVFLDLYKGPTIDDYINIKLEDGLTFPNYTFFDASRDTVFYLHGWSEDPDLREESFKVITSAFLEKNFVNLVVLDYSELVKGDRVDQYLEAFFNATKIGNALGQYLQQYIPFVQPLERVHLISHSLGSQILARTARTYGKGILKWLTGLDPAGPLFNIPGVEYLSKDDGVFVDIIHTDGGAYGDFRSVGTVDFFPNLGRRVQPYCEGAGLLGFCSHHMSWKYYAESIRNNTAFLAKRCHRTILCETTIALCDCDKYPGQTTYIGYTVDKNAKGNYYLETNEKSPFGKGVDGINF